MDNSSMPYFVGMIPTSDKRVFSVKLNRPPISEAIVTIPNSNPHGTLLLAMTTAKGHSLTKAAPMGDLARAIRLRPRGTQTLIPKLGQGDFLKGLKPLLLFLTHGSPCGFN